MTTPTLSAAVDMIIRKAMLMHMDCRVGHIDALLEIRSKLQPLLKPLDEMLIICEQSGHAVSLSAEFRKARDEIISGNK